MYDAKHRKPVQIGPYCRWSGGARSTGDIDYIVIHSAESDSDAAQGVARYGATTDRKVSWHVVCDKRVLIRQLADAKVSWTAPPKNTDGLHIELCGRAAYSRLAWYRNQATLKRAAWQVAKWCQLYGIPAVWLTDHELRMGSKRGIITHSQVSQVFKQSTHWDPGPNFPKGRFLRMVRRRLRWLEKGK